jgi:glycosyltransferase involved in cell wall biosynthesis
MRIAFAIHDARPGGGQDRYGLELVNRLSKNHDVTLFARSAEGLSPDVTFEKIVTPTRPGLLRSKVFASKVRRCAAASEWDIVHTIGGAVPGATVITAQFCQTASRAAEKRWPSFLVGRLMRFYRTVEALAAIRAERQATRHPSLRALIAVSNRTLGEWRNAYGLSASIQAVTPNGVDVTRFRPGDDSDREELRAELGLPSSGRILLLVGALVRKGIETALQSLVQLGDEVFLLAVGAGPHERVRALADGYGIQNRLRLVNPVPDVERYYRGSDIFFFPTRYEPFGMVIAEAWAAHEEEVLKIAYPSDATAFASAATRLLEDSGLASRLSDRGRALARQMSWERVAAETEAVYHRVVGE